MSRRKDRTLPPEGSPPGARSPTTPPGFPRLRELMSFLGGRELTAVGCPWGDGLPDSGDTDDIICWIKNGAHAAVMVITLNTYERFSQT